MKLVSRIRHVKRDSVRAANFVFINNKGNN